MVNMNPNIDVTLDEIILKNKKKPTLIRKQDGYKKQGVAKVQGIQKAKIVAKPIILKRTMAPNVSDVRNFLIQQKRSKLTDAREQLAKIAKSTDVRSKLNKIRGEDPSKKNPVDMRQKLNMKQKFNSQVPKVTSKPQKIVFTQNKTESKPAGQTQVFGNSLTRTVSGGRPQMQTAPVTRTIAGAKQPIRRNNPLRMVQNTTQQKVRPLKVAAVSNNQARSRALVKSAIRAPVRQQIRQTVMQQRRPVSLRSYEPRESPVAVSRPVYRQVPAPRTQYIIEEDYLPPAPAPTVVYRSARRQPQPTIIYEEPPRYQSYQEPAYYEDQTDSYYTEEEYHPPPQQIYVPPPARQPVQRSLPRQMRQPVFQEETYGPPAPPQQRQQYNSFTSPRNVRQQSFRRVNNQPQQLRQAAPRASPKVVGHKVSVSNLHAATREDIEELFGNIGPISSCNMIRSDTAVVVFCNLSDAKKSVEVYHNRKLDNQPMNVKIIGTVTENTPIRGGNRGRLQ